MMSLTRFLAVAAIALAAGGCGHSQNHDHGVSFLDVAQAAARQSDRVSVEELAGWLIEERADFVLIDVRSPDDVEQGRIGDAENIPIVELVTAEALETLPTDRKIVVYSNGSENSAKASVLLRLAGFDSLVLAGGYNAWHARILNPDIPAEELDGESLQVSEQRAYACYFVGERSGAAERPEAGNVEFEPPVFDTEEEMAPLPPAKEEGC
jgi:rhodanese-related sulfurtransferase